MAGKIKPMSQIKQLLNMHRQGYGKKRIARNLGISRNTVKMYLSKLDSMSIKPDELLQLEEPVLEARFHAGNPAYKDNDRYEHFKGLMDYFQSELKKRGVTKKLLWEEYRQTQPCGYGYAQFCFHLDQQLLAHKPSMVLNHKAGEKLYVDFAGAKMSYVNRDTGELVWCPVFVACLPYSDFCYALVVKSQRIEDFIYALINCLLFLGGAPQILVPDNLKSAITRADKYEPDITRALEDFCNHYHMAVVPARVRKPKDKALVENQVKLIYNRVYAKLRHQTFFDLDSLNKAVMEKVVLHNQTRMQLHPYCREEKFLAEEKHTLSPLPEELYEIKYYRQYKVLSNNHILLYPDKHYYSVPYQWTGQKAKIIYTVAMVRIYVQGQLVAVHQRNRAPGTYSTIREHLCSHHNHYLSRSPEYYKTRAKEKSELLYQLIEILFSGGRPPEQNYRSCDGLFRLHKKTDTALFNKACQIAIACRHCSYRYLLTTIENLKRMPATDQESEPRPLPSHGNIRGKDYYIQTTLNL
jgi:transposase